MKIAKELAKAAQDKGICTDWLIDLNETNDIEKLLSMYIQGIDFCLANNYPDNEYIRANFKGKMEHRGIYLDDDFRAENCRVVVALGQCSGNIELSSYQVSELFVKHESELMVVARENSFVMIDIFDNAKLTVLACDNAKVCVNRYGGMVTHRLKGKAAFKIIEKNQKTY